MSLAFTCEGCEAQPPEVFNIELTPNLQGVGRTTVCKDCLDILQELPPTDARVIALKNRIADFKTAWPVKADMNIIAYAASLVKTQPDTALEIVVEWSKRKHAA